MEYLEQLVAEHAKSDDFTKARLGLAELDRYDNALFDIDEEAPLGKSSAIPPILAIFNRYDCGDIDADTAKLMLREARCAANSYLATHGFHGEKYLTFGRDTLAASNEFIKKHSP